MPKGPGLADWRAGFTGVDRRRADSAALPSPRRPWLFPGVTPPGARVGGRVSAHAYTDIGGRKYGGHGESPSLSSAADGLLDTRERNAAGGAGWSAPSFWHFRKAQHHVRGASAPVAD